MSRLLTAALVTPMLLYLFYRLGSAALARFLLVPTHDWKERILKVINFDKPIYLNVGSKRSAFRRRLICASHQPAFYTNYTSNKVRVSPLDAERNSDFVANMAHRDPKDPVRKVVYGFFHPYANNGGGGEKVLWQAVEATLGDPRAVVAIYLASPAAEPQLVLSKAQQKFNVAGLDPDRIVFVYLRRYSRLIGAAAWPRFTLVGQLLGLALLALEALFELTPDVWIDTMGLPGGNLPVSWIVRVPIVAYVHYPIIQQDMFARLRFQRVADLRRFRPLLSDATQAAKFVYWLALYYAYTYLGSCVDITLANGSWTYQHLRAIWLRNAPESVHVLYPPCSTELLAVDETHPRRNTLLYIAQFRPEKRHALVVSEYHAFVDKFRAAKRPVLQLPQLVLLGLCRTPDDTATLMALRAQTEELGLADHVEFVVDCLFETVLKYLSESKFGLNAMWNEHFGIGVVEYVAAGVVPIVHASAGPHLDIVCQDQPAELWENKAGYFFKSEQDADFSGTKAGDELGFKVGLTMCYYPTLCGVLQRLFLEEKDLDAKVAVKRETGRQLVASKFSNGKFDEAWAKYMGQATALELVYREERRGAVERVF